MHIHRVKSKQGDKVYQQILLRESYREPGEERSKVKKRTLLNLTKYPENVVKAIEIALQHRNNLPELEALLDSKPKRKQGKVIGAVWVLKKLFQDLGIRSAMGHSRNSLLCIWMIMARLIDQGSRLSSVRLAREHCVDGILGLDSFNEDDLYSALDWLSENQDRIERNLFRKAFEANPPVMFLYDVTSSYLEGDQNELADWGYNRDKKRGKKQIVIGLLCTEGGVPVAVRVFKGNTTDLQTFSSQIEKVAEDFGCKKVTMVGDRGMIKSAQIEELGSAKFSYITAITKPQIRSMLNKGAIQLGLFDSKVCEVEYNRVRYILRRNPIRAAELLQSRMQRIEAVEAFAAEQNKYLAEHPNADPSVALKKVWAKEERLKVDSFLRTSRVDRLIRVERDEEYLTEVGELDGCYVLKTDLPAEIISAKAVHDRYKDLAQVEHAFRTCKTGHLEVRPIFVRKESRTRAHVFVIMLAYIIRRRLAEAWKNLDITVEEGLRQLSSLCSVGYEFESNRASVYYVPAPRDDVAQLFDALEMTPPVALPGVKNGKVGTRRKLGGRRK